MLFLHILLIILVHFLMFSTKIHKKTFCSFKTGNSGEQPACLSKTKQDMIKGHYVILENTFKLSNSKI